MSDWRGGDSKDDKRRKDKNPKPRALPVILPKYPSPSNETSTNSSDWRGKSKSKNSVQAESERTWTGAGKQVAPTTVLKKSVVVGLLGVTIFSLFSWLVWIVFHRDPLLPIVISVSEEYASNGLWENPYGVQTNSQLKAVKPEHLKLISSNEVPDQFVRAVDDGDNWIKNFSEIKDYLNSSGEIVGRGPGKNVMVYFVSGLIARAENQPEEWVLLHKDKIPYRSLVAPYRPTSQLTIAKFLERIAKQTAQGSYAWIVFDVKPPNVVANLGDLSFPYTAFKTPFENLDNQLKDRLIISLPCGDSEESWMAPQFNSSVFAHFFWKGATSGFGTQSGVVTLDDFERKLGEEVRDWVALNMFAKQTPQFLYSDEKVKKGIRLFNMAGKPYPLVDSTFKGFASKPEEMNGFWDRYDKLKPSLQWEPLRFAKIESQLIQMEELAESDSKRWLIFKGRVEADLLDLETRSFFDRRVSLIESKLHSQVRPCKIFSTEVMNSKAIWIEKPPFWQGDQESSVANLTREDKCLQVWTVLEESARSEKAEIWATSFTKERLEKCLAYCGQVEQDNVEWLEIQILRILVDALPSETNSDAIKSLARTLQLFCDLNKIAFDPRTELTRWTRKRLLGLDQMFFNVFDLFVANQFKESIQAFESMNGRVNELMDDFKKLKDAMAIRDKVFWLTPHLLSALMREYRYASIEDSKEILIETRVLQESLKKAIGLRDFFSGDPETTKIQLNWDPEQDLASVLDYVEKKYRLVKNRSNDVETIPSTRNALRWPLLDLKTRKEFHLKLAELYAISKPGKVNTTLAQRSPEAVSKEFYNGLDDFKGKSLYRNMAMDDARLSGLALVSQETEAVDSKRGSEPNQIIADVYTKSYLTRIAANSFGQSTLGTTSREVAETWTWPWDSATQFDQINTSIYNQFQAERLCRARWGDGNLDGRSPGKYYFRLLESKFKSATSLLKDFPQASPLSNLLDRERIAFSDLASHDVNQVDVSIPSIAPMGEKGVPVSLTGNPWKASATLFVHENESIDRKAFSSSKNRSVSVAFNEPAKPFEMKIDPKLVGRGERLRVSVRGHYRDRPILLEDEKNSERVDFIREEIKPSTLLVTAAKGDPIILWILFDCSASMDENSIHGKAKQAVKELLNRIQERNATESPIHVGLIVFGRKSDDPPPAGLRRSENGNQIFETKIKEVNEIDSLVGLLDSPWMEPSGCTPLYAAILTACENIEKMKDVRTSRIVVVSDGSDDVVYRDPNEEAKEGSVNFYRFVGLTVKAGDVKQKIKQVGTSLFVFQFENLAYYKKDEAKLNEIKRSNAELQGLINDVLKPGQRNGKLFFQDFDSLTESLLASLPKTTVTVRSNQGPIGIGEVGKIITLDPIVTKPTEAIVSVQGIAQRAETTVWLAGNEKLKFKYSDSAGLMNLPFNDKDNGDRAILGDFRKQMTSESDSKYLLFAQPFPDRSAKKLGISVAIPGSSKDVEQKKFIRRPEFVIAAMTPSDGGPDSSRLISDFSFYPGTHYPILKFPAFKWKQEEAWLSTKVDFDVWISIEMPSATLAPRLSLKSGDDGKFLEQVKQVNCSRKENTITAIIDEKQLSSESSERYFVICTSASNSVRQFVENRETKAVFELAESEAGKAADVLVVKKSDLEKAVADGLIQHFWTKGMEFRN